MKTWDKFLLNKDPETEKEIRRIYLIEKTAIRDISQTLYFNIGKIGEEELSRVSFGAISRCCTCMESILVLLQNGYYGSADALLRQVYELLAWAKIAIDTEDHDASNAIHASYYIVIPILYLLYRYRVCC